MGLAIHHIPAGVCLVVLFRVGWLDLACISKALFSIILVREVVFHLKCIFYTDSVPLLASQLNHNRVYVLRLRFIGLTSGFIAYFHQLEIGAEALELGVEIACQLSVVGFLLLVIKVTRCTVQDDKVLKRTNHLVVGKGCAVVQYSFLENVIKGKNGTPPYPEMLRKFKEQEMDPNDLVEPKVMILFPESLQFSGSVEALIDREQTKQNRRKARNQRIPSSHRILFQTLKYSYKVGFRDRTAQLQVMQVTETDDIAKARPIDEVKKRYIVMVENRPLKAMYNMVKDPVIQFTRKDLTVQINIYMNHLRKLLDKDVKCKGMYELIHFKLKNENVDIGKIILDQIYEVEAISRSHINL